MSTGIAAICCVGSAVAFAAGDRGSSELVDLGSSYGLLLILRVPVGPLDLGWSRQRIYTLLRSVEANRALLDQRGSEDS